MRRLDGKVAVVTGASSGIGAATARLFAREGASVVVVANHNVAGAEDVVATIRSGGEQSVFVQADVSREADCKRIMDTAVEVFGRLDILINNAGIQSGTPTTELTEEEFDRVMGVNVKGVFFCCKHAVPYMKQNGGGAIVTTSLARRTDSDERCADLLREQSRRSGMDPRGRSGARAERDPRQHHLARQHRYADVERVHRKQRGSHSDACLVRPGAADGPAPVPLKIVPMRCYFWCRRSLRSSRTRRCSSTEGCSFRRAWLEAVRTGQVPILFDTAKGGQPCDDRDEDRADR